jgi:hypothetical protein
MTSLRNLLIAVAALAILTDAGCRDSSTTTTSLVVTVQIESALNLDTLKVVANAAGRSDVENDYTPIPASPVRWTVQISNAPTPFEATVTATGQRGGQDILRYAAFATVTPGQESDVLLKLTAACAGSQAPTCAPDQNCDNGGCVEKPGSGGPDGGPPPAKRCVHDTDCGSGGHCSDGVCCDGACTAGCYSCLAADTGGLDGQCLPVVANTSDGTCTKQPEASCKNTGACDGQGHCQLQPNTVECGAASCSGTTYQPPSMCDGSGSCVSVSARDCGPYLCNGNVSCKTSCTNDSDCSAQSFCTNGTCTHAVCTTDGWCWHNPRPDGVTKAIWGPSPNDVWAVGDSGTIAHWDGTTWQGFTSVSDTNLISVHGADGIVWAVGGNGATASVMLKWDGFAWRTLSNISTRQLWDVWAATATDAWVTDQYAVWRWNGTTWESESLPIQPADGSFEAISGSSANNVWVASDRAAFHWDGVNWSREDLSSVLPIGYVVDLVVDSNGEAWATTNSCDGCGPNPIIHRTNPGWTIAAQPSNGGDINSRIALSPAGRIWVLGQDGNMYTWNPAQGDTAPVSVPSLQNTIATSLLTFSDTDTRFAVGSVEVWDGTHLTNSFTGGTSTDTMGPLSFSGSDGWAQGEPNDGTPGIVRFYHFTGTGWSYEAGGDRSSSNALYTIGSGLWDVGQGPTFSRWDGTQWYSLVNDTATTDVFNAVSGDPSYIYAVGSGGRVVTSNVATNEVDASINSGTTVNLFSVADSDGDVWAVGAAGTVIHRTGLGPFSVVSNTGAGTTLLTSVCANTGQDLWVVGQNSTILHYTGTTWSSANQGFPATSSLTQITCFGGDPWAIALDGAVWHYANGIWNSSTAPVQLSGITSTTQAVWVTGRNGAILERTR